MSDIQNIAIISTQTDPLPKPHVSYTIQVSTPTRTWTVNRRYNDFVALNAELKASTDKEPPSPLPPKSWGFTRTANDEKIRERRIHLETYLRTILTTKDPRWRTTFGFGDFLGVPSSSKPSVSSSGPSQWTPSTWLAEHGEVTALLRNARSALLKRDALAAMADASGSRGASAEAKRALRDLSSKIMALEKGLAIIGPALGEGERRRREDMMESIRIEQAALLRTAEAGVRTAQASQTSSITSSAFHSGPSQSMPGAFHPTAPVSSGRVFGRRAEPQETEHTRPLDDRGLLQLQQTQVSNQDAQLTELSRLLQKQRVMGEEIAQEIAEQNEMLDDVDMQVTKVGAKIGRAKRELNRLQ